MSYDMSDNLISFKIIVFSDPGIVARRRKKCLVHGSVSQSVFGATKTNGMAQFAHSSQNKIKI